MRGRAAVGVPAGLDVVDVARVSVSSEQACFPIDSVFDRQRGPGGSRWIASSGGEQTVLVAFDEPQDIRSIVVESEHRGGMTQLTLDLAVGDGEAFEELGSRAFAFRPYGPSVRSETWRLPPGVVKQVRIRVTPATPAERACLTSVVFLA